MKLVFNFFLFLSLIAPAMSHAYSFSGNFKSFPILVKPALMDETRKSWQNKVLLQVNAELPYEGKFEAAYELTVNTEKPTRHQTPVIGYRVDDLNYFVHDNAPSDKYKTSVIQNLNRFNFNFSSHLGDLIIGRVPLAFGVSKSVSATDVLTPFAPNTIDKEERTGIDALILKMPLLPALLLEAGFVGGKNLDKDKNAYYVRPKLTIEKWDAALMYLNFKEKKLLGVELQHPINDAGFWFEYAYLDNNRPLLKDFSRATTGIDYKFQNSLYLAFEYHYNGASLNNGLIYPEDFLYLAYKHYFILTSSYEFTPLLIGSLQNYFDGKDQSNLTAAKLDYNVTENSYLSLGTFLGTGNERSTEFGRYGKIYYGAYRYYF